MNRPKSTTTHMYGMFRPVRQAAPRRGRSLPSSTTSLGSSAVCNVTCLLTNKLCSGNDVLVHYCSVNWQAT